MPDPQMLSRLLESGAYDRYVQEFLDQQYGRGYVSPYARQRLSKEAPQTVGRLVAESLVNNGPTSMLDNADLERQLQQALMAQMSGQSTPASKSTAPRLLELLSQWRNADPMSEEGIMATALLNDPTTLKSLVLASMPRGYGGFFNQAYTNAISRGLEDAAYASPSEGDYVGKIANLVGGITQTPTSITEAMRSPIPPTPAYSGPLPDTAEAIAAIQKSRTDPLSGITPEELFALRQLVGE